MQKSTFPLVSIITPSYNQTRFLEATILSVLNQDYPAIEYIIMDGGSTDGSVDIVRRYSERLAYWVSERDAGQSDAINKGWRLARGEIVAYLNSDDTYEPGAVRAAINFFSQHPQVGMIYGACNQLDEDGNIVGMLRATPFDLKQLLLTDTIVQPTVFLRRAVLDTVGILDTRLHYAMDYDLWLRAALHFQISALDRTLANFRAHRGSKSFSRPAEALQDLLTIVERIFNDLALPAAYRPLKNLAVAHAYLQSIFLCYSLEQNALGKQLWLELLARDPLLAVAPEFLVEKFAHHLVHVVLKPWISASEPKKPHDEQDAEHWLDRVLPDFPADARHRAAVRSRILSRMHLVQAFEAYESRDLPQARAQLWRTLQTSPSEFLNRGALSILLESIFGSRALNTWRALRGHLNIPQTQV